MMYSIAIITIVMFPPGGNCGPMILPFRGQCAPSQGAACLNNDDDNDGRYYIDVHNTSIRITYMYVYIYIYIYIHISICVYIYIYIYNDTTNNHTRNSERPPQELRSGHTYHIYIYI